MTDKRLLESLSRLGLPLMETSEDLDVNLTLAEVVKSRDARLWEGFPVVLVNAARDYRFGYQQVLDNLTSDEERADFHRLLLLSLAMYDSAHLSFSWMNRLKERFTDEEKAQLKSLRSSLARDEMFDFDGMQFHPARVRGSSSSISSRMPGRAGNRRNATKSCRSSMPCPRCFLRSRRSCSGRSWTGCRCPRPKRSITPGPSRRRSWPWPMRSCIVWRRS